MTKSFGQLPERMRCDAVRGYFEILDRKRGSLLLKRGFDILVSAALLVLASPVLLGVAVAVKLDSPGPVFFRQARYTTNLRVFRIFKFRSMVDRAEEAGPLVTVDGDARVTRVGGFLRRTRLDELPQLLNVLAGDMSFVGTRPEVGKYVERYSDEMLATLLMPAGVTSLASIRFKDEAALLESADDADEVYVNEILPRKMAFNLAYLREFSFWGDVKLMFSTVSAMRE